MLRRLVIGLLVVAVALYALLYALGLGLLGEDWGAGVPSDLPIPQEIVESRSDVQWVGARGVGVAEPRQILFGDLHVHTTYSTDAFMMALPSSGGDGARPVSDACDYARYCSALDFWSINDHALALTPQRWQETVDGIRQCNAVSGDPASPDVSAFLGWEWTQVGTEPANHWGHKNIVLRHLDDERIPARPIASGSPGGANADRRPSNAVLGLGVVLGGSEGPDLVRYFRGFFDTPRCPEGRPVRELPSDCIENALAPADLFEKLDDWGHEALVIPHGTTWGFYTPAGSSWDKQLTPAQHDPDWQTLIEVFSGHGNSEEYRDWRAALVSDRGALACAEPTDDYLPSCWQAGEIIRGRCLDAGEDAAECDARAAAARENYVAAGISGFLTVPGQKGNEWGEAGQCRDCFLPAFNYRPRGSVQYIMALSAFPDGASAPPLRFRFGFLSSSDNHSARPGTGYKELDRRDSTEMRFEAFSQGPLGYRDDRGPEPSSEPFEPEDASQFFGLRETERQSSFFMTGGLVAAHAEGRSRDAVWEALERREVYGTSGPRILLWFDLVNPPGTRGSVLPMGSEIAMVESPVFRVRAVGSFEQQPGCPDYATGSIGPEHLARLCKGECYHPSDTRRTVTRIEVVRIRPQSAPGEPVGPAIEDPWRVIECDPDPAGCRVTFSDADYVTEKRDTLYYVRAIEAPSPALNADPIGCASVPLDVDCLADVEERAWSSPIFVDYASSDRASSDRASSDRVTPVAARP